MKVRLLSHKDNPKRKAILIGLTREDIQRMTTDDNLISMEDLPDLHGRTELYVGVFSDNPEIEQYLARFESSPEEQDLN